MVLQPTTDREEVLRAAGYQGSPSTDLFRRQPDNVATSVTGSATADFSEFGMRLDNGADGDTAEAAIGRYSRSENFKVFRRTIVYAVNSAVNPPDGDDLYLGVVPSGGIGATNSIAVLDWNNEQFIAGDDDNIATAPATVDTAQYCSELVIEADYENDETRFIQPGLGDDVTISERPERIWEYFATVGFNGANNSHRIQSVRDQIVR